MKLWIKDPMAMATPAPQANSGLLIEDGLITAVLDRPPEAFDEVFDASKNPKPEISDLLTLPIGVLVYVKKSCFLRIRILG